MKILLIDDSALMLKHVSDLLAKRGYSVVKASNLPEALEAFYLHCPDAVLADFVLEGGQTGLGTIQAIFAASAGSAAASGASGVFLKRSSPKKPAAAILTLGALSADDQTKAKSLGVPVLQKPKQGQEEAFLLDVAVWLKQALKVPT